MLRKIRSCNWRYARLFSAVDLSSRTMLSVEQHEKELGHCRGPERMLTCNFYLQVVAACLSVFTRLDSLL